VNMTARTIFARFFTLFLLLFLAQLLRWQPRVFSE